MGAVPNYAARWLAAYDESLALRFHSYHAPLVRDELLIELSILRATQALHVKTSEHFVLLRVLDPLVLMHLMLIFHVDPAMIHPPEPPLKRLQMFPLPDGHRMSIPILHGLLYHLSQICDEVVIIVCQGGDLLADRLYQGVEVREYLLHLDIVRCLRLIGTQIPHKFYFIRLSLCIS